MDKLGKGGESIFKTDLSTIGPPSYNYTEGELFLDRKEGIIDYDAFRYHFDQVSLPIELAQDCLNNTFQEVDGRRTSDAFVKFIKLSTLRKHDRLPTYLDVKDELVDFRDVNGFALQGRLSLWGGKDIFCNGNFVFVSHRWQTPDHPDPDGLKIKLIIDKLNTPSATVDEIYVWIDFCCIPQSNTRHEWSVDDIRNFYSGLLVLANIVKSCDLLILYSEDYLSRVWCYTELFVWLCKFSEVGSTTFDYNSRLFRSVQTRHIVSSSGSRTNAAFFPENFYSNLCFRGYAGSKDVLLSIFKPVDKYADTVKESASHHLRRDEVEYLPTLVAFMCKSWFLLQQMESSNPADKEVCLRVLMEALKFND